MGGRSVDALFPSGPLNNFLPSQFRSPTLSRSVNFPSTLSGNLAEDVFKARKWL
jgi:hypothetical protein